MPLHKIEEEFIQEQLNSWLTPEFRTSSTSSSSSSSSVAPPAAAAAAAPAPAAAPSASLIDLLCQHLQTSTDQHTLVDWRACFAPVEAMRCTRAIEGTLYHIASFSADKLKCARKALQVAYRVSEEQLLWQIAMVAVHKSNGPSVHPLSV